MLSLAKSSFQLIKRIYIKFNKEKAHQVIKNSNFNVTSLSRNVKISCLLCINNVIKDLTLVKVDMSVITV
ncbi:hypothetical protein Syun_027957 [Stephania yunnanensis]|uniref:Uncharacterized protein n=1 Tax=Stephania yunnanensis TaxID=152371 RepID=A0AAP0HQP4_9MAGN